jgi:DNA invertase Pin-like site-specific DNA recombinase
VLIGYARVSTGEQDLALQLDALTAAGCERCFSDTASGSLQERPQLTHALEDLRDGHDTLMVWRLDRLGRSLRHLIELIGELEQRQLGFRSLTEGIDTTTSSGRLVFHIFASIAEFEHQLIRERTQAGLQAARARGRLGGRRTVITEDKLAIARELLAGGNHTMAQIAATVGVGRATLYRHLDIDRARANAAAVSAGSEGERAAGGQAEVRREQPVGRPAEKPSQPVRTRSRKAARPSQSRVAGAEAAGSDRRQWLAERCPKCGAAPGARCRTQQVGRAARPAARLHVARGWRQRRCPAWDALPGRDCLTPSGRRASGPHHARIAPAAGELVFVREVWEELEGRGAGRATVPFGGERRTGARFGPVTLVRVENGREVELERWESAGDQLIEALKALVSERFGAFAGQPAISGTLSWSVADRRIVIGGRRGERPFEETLR